MFFEYICWEGKALTRALLDQADRLFICFEKFIYIYKVIYGYHTQMHVCVCISILCQSLSPQAITEEIPCPTE